MLLLHASSASRSSPWCVDKEREACSGWAAAGECAKIPGFMSGYCMHSCDACDKIDASTLRLGPERVVMSTPYGAITLGFFQDVALVTVNHIVQLFELGCD